MVRHIVMWKLKETAEGGTKFDNAAIMKQRLEALVGVIDGLVSASVSPVGFSEGFNLCLDSTFESKEALAFYQKHPEHQKVREFVHSVIENRSACDFEF